jgi:hypothetical protein
MTRWTLLIAALTSVALAGCSAATLPYTPETQPSGAKVSAAYALVGDRVRIEVDTGKRRLEEASIAKPDGSVLQAQAIELGPPTTSSSSPISIGIGGGSYGGGVGTGVGVGFPVGGGSSTSDGNTYAFFPAAQAGPPPWRLTVKLSGAAPVVILVGTAPGAGR